MNGDPLMSSGDKIIDKMNDAMTTGKHFFIKKHILLSNTNAISSSDNV